MATLVYCDSYRDIHKPSKRLHWNKMSSSIVATHPGQQFKIHVALVELTNVSWPLLGTVLGVPKQIESTAARKSRRMNSEKQNKYAMNLILEYWFENQKKDDRNWGTFLANTMFTPFMDHTWNYLYDKYVRPDNFTADLMSQEVLFLKDKEVFVFGQNLLDSSVEPKKICEFPIEKKKKLEILLSYWKKKHYDVPSWEELCRVLEDTFNCEHHVANIREKYVPRRCHELSDVFLDIEHTMYPALPKATKDNVKLLLEDVDDYLCLAVLLNVSDKDVQEIEINNLMDEKKCVDEILDKWCGQTDERVRWSKLGEQLQKMRRHTGLGRHLMSASNVSRV